MKRRTCIGCGYVCEADCIDGDGHPYKGCGRGCQILTLAQIGAKATVTEQRTDKASSESFICGDIVSLYGAGEYQVIDVRNGWVRTPDTDTSSNHWHCLSAGHVKLVRPGEYPFLPDSEVQRRAVAVLECWDRADRDHRLALIRSQIHVAFRDGLKAREQRVDYPTAAAVIALIREHQETAFANCETEAGTYLTSLLNAVAQLTDQRSAKAKAEGFAERLLAVWTEAQNVAIDPSDFPVWDGATKDLLLGLGLEWDGETEEYYLNAVRAKERRDARRIAKAGK